MRTRILLSITLPLLAAAGCGGVNERQRTWLAEGERAYQDKQPALAVDRLSDFLGAVQDGPESARARYVRGMALAQLGRRAAAYADLQRAVDGSADPEVTWRANAALGVLCFEDENWTAAGRALAAATSEMPAEPPADAFLYRLGLCYERTGRWGDAQTVYRQLVSRFPSGRYAAVASRRVELRADHFAIQCGVFSQAPSADRLVAELRQQGLEAYVRPEVRNGQACRVVCVGRYATYREAIAELARVRGYVSNAVLWP